jgi:hypothetical protein
MESARLAVRLNRYVLEGRIGRAQEIQDTDQTWKAEPEGSAP